MQGGHRIAFTGIKDLFEQHRAVSRRNPHPGRADRHNLDPRCYVGHHLHQRILHQRVIGHHRSHHLINRRRVADRGSKIRIDRGNRPVTRGQNRHRQSLGAVNPVGGRGACHLIGNRRGRTHQGRIATDIAQGVNLGHHGGGLIHRGQLHALHLLQHRPAAITQTADQRDQHGKRAYGPRLHPGKQAFGARHKAGIDKGITVFRRLCPVARRRHRGGRGGSRHAMRHFEIRLKAKAGKGRVGFHAQIARIRPHITRDEALSLKRRHIGVFDGGDVAGLDFQVALHVQQRFAQRGTLTPHQVAKTHVVIVKAPWLVDHRRRCAEPPPDHAHCPMLVPFTSGHLQRGDSFGSVFRKR